LLLTIPLPVIISTFFLTGAQYFLFDSGVIIPQFLKMKIIFYDALKIFSPPRKDKKKQVPYPQLSGQTN
jgi:hypothetical protein